MAGAIAIGSGEGGLLLLAESGEGFLEVPQPVRLGVISVGR